MKADFVENIKRKQYKVLQATEHSYQINTAKYKFHKFHQKRINFNLSLILLLNFALNDENKDYTLDTLINPYQIIISTTRSFTENFQNDENFSKEWILEPRFTNNIALIQKYAIKKM
jgi:hypothetical protein